MSYKDYIHANRSAYTSKNLKEYNAVDESIKDFFLTEEFFCEYSGYELWNRKKEGKRVLLVNKLNGVIAIGNNEGISTYFNLFSGKLVGRKYGKWKSKVKRGEFTANVSRYVSDEEFKALLEYVYGFEMNINVSQRKIYCILKYCGNLVEPIFRESVNCDWLLTLMSSYIGKKIRENSLREFWGFKSRTDWNYILKQKDDALLAFWVVCGEKNTLKECEKIMYDVLVINNKEGLEKRRETDGADVPVPERGKTELSINGGYYLIFRSMNIPSWIWLGQQCDLSLIKLAHYLGRQLNNYPNFVYPEIVKYLWDYNRLRYYIDQYNIEHVYYMNSRYSNDYGYKLFPKRLVEAHNEAVEEFNEIYGSSGIVVGRKHPQPQ